MMTIQLNCWIRMCMCVLLINFKLLSTRNRPFTFSFFSWNSEIIFWHSYRSHNLRHTIDTRIGQWTFESCCLASVDLTWTIYCIAILASQCMFGYTGIWMNVHSIWFDSQLCKSNSHPGCWLVIFQLPKCEETVDYQLRFLVHGHRIYLKSLNWRRLETEEWCWCQQFCHQFYSWVEFHLGFLKCYWSEWGVDFQFQ